MAIQRSGTTQEVWELVWGGGGGLFWSNAPTYSSLAGEFATTIISTPFVGVEIVGFKFEVQQNVV